MIKRETNYYSSLNKLMKVEKQIAMDFKTIQEEVSHFIVLGDSANQAK